MESWQTILTYWFGDNAKVQEIIDGKASLWWGKDRVIDQDISDRFGVLHAGLAAGELGSWQLEPRSRLALIILADQFSRNMFRNDKRAFAMDPLALSLALEGIELSMDRQLRWVERVFFYMPLEHSETLAMQDYSVRLFRELDAEVAIEEKQAINNYIDFAERHREIIARFNRFPHRNEVLGRESTPEEIEFLQQPGSGF